MSDDQGAPKKPLPSFATEDEETRWYSEHRDVLDDYFPPKAVQDARPLHQRLGLPDRPKRDKLVLKSINLNEADIELARKLAVAKGVGAYQTLIRMLLHEALQAEAKRYKLS